MARRAILLLCCASALAGPFFTGASSWAQDSPVTTEVPPSKEAWYHEAEPCIGFVDCSALPPSSPYPEDTLHVSLSGGEETARTYIAFSLLLPAGGQLQEGTLSLPVDTDESHGSASPETADLVACITTPKFEDARGSFAKPPDADCEIRKSALYSEKRREFEVDLSRFLDEWSQADGEIALALLPSPRALEGTGTWHVVFPASEDETEDPPEGDERQRRAITASFEYTVDGDDTDIGNEFDFSTGSGTPVTSGDTSGDFSSGSAPSFEGSTSPGTDGGDLAGAADPSEALGPQTQPVVTFLEGFAGPGFAYPIIWAFPLVLMIGIGALGRALTKDLYRADD